MIHFTRCLPTYALINNVPLTGAGGRPPYQWTAQPLPSWLAVNASGSNTAALVGTPLQAGDNDFTITLSDGVRRISASIRFRVVAFRITLASALPAGGVGRPYSTALTSTGTNVTWQARALPAGLRIEGDRLMGVPSAAGTTEIQLDARDQSGVVSSVTVSLTIHAVAAITTTSLRDAVRGESYTAPLAAVGAPPLVWSLESGELPGGIVLDHVNGVLSGTATAAPGAYRFRLGVRDVFGQQAVRDLVLNVAAGTAGPALVFQPANLTIQLPVGTTRRRETVLIRTDAAQPLRIEISQDQPWIVPLQTSLTVDQTASFEFEINPAGLLANTYQGSISMRAGIARQVLPITLQLYTTASSLDVSPLGLTFQAVEGLPAPPARNIFIRNPGSRDFAWELAESELSKAIPWLRLLNRSGTAPPGGQNASASIAVDPAGLPAGTYYAVVDVKANGVPNSPQSVVVVLNVAPAGSGSNAPEIQHSALLFTPGSPEPKPLQFTSPFASTQQYTMQVSTITGGPWLDATPKSGSIAAGATTTGMVSVNTAGLSPGVYRGQVALSVGGRNRAADVVLVVPSSAPAAIAQAGSFAFAAPQTPFSTCIPRSLAPVFTSIGPNFRVPAAWPTPIELVVANDCGDPMNTGSVILTFSNNDPAVSLTSLGNGRWIGTWVGRNVTVSQVTITVTAVQPAAGIQGTHLITGTLASNSNPPLVNPGGVVNGASFAPREAVAPGSLISIFGSRLADTDAVATALPLTRRLGETTVTLGGRELPLIFVGNGQINALVPFELSPNETLPLLVRRGGSFSVPEMVSISSEQPGMFSAGAMGAFLNAQSGTPITQDPPRPGQWVTIFATGLGAVSPSVPTGEAAPVSPLASAVKAVVARIGRLQAEVGYAGLAPGFAGLYQINVRVPANVEPSRDVEVLLTTGERTSLPAKMPVLPSQP